jgi:hypothetical protein
LDLLHLHLAVGRLVGSLLAVSVGALEVNEIAVELSTTSS